MVGIYKITNVKNGKIYIGESLDIEERWNKHKQDLINGTHHFYKLQEDFNAYGKYYFKFEVIDEIDKNLKLIIQKCLLVIYEDKYIKQYNSINEGYNVENSLELILESKKALFDGQQINKKVKYIINEIVKNIEQNNGIYLSTKNAIKKENENIIKETKIKKESKSKINIDKIFTKENINIIIS